MKTFTPAQELVVKHYLGGEFAHIRNPEVVPDLGDGLLTFLVNEAGDADTTEFKDMLRRAIDQLRSLHDEINPL